MSVQSISERLKMRKVNLGVRRYLCSITSLWYISLGPTLCTLGRDVSDACRRRLHVRVSLARGMPSPNRFFIVVYVWEKQADAGLHINYLQPADSKHTSSQVKGKRYGKKGFFLYKAVALDWSIHWFIHGHRRCRRQKFIYLFLLTNCFCSSHQWFWDSVGTANLFLSHTWV